MNRRQLADVYEALNDAIEHIGGEVDVVDGDYGEPEPNAAMKLHGKLNNALGIIDRAFLEVTT